MVIETGVVNTCLTAPKRSLPPTPPGGSTRQTRPSLAIAWLLLGLTPNPAVFGSSVSMDTFGEILVDENCRTDVPGQFAVVDAISVEGKTAR